MTQAITGPTTDEPTTASVAWQEIPSRRETLGEALSGMFTGGSGLSAALTLALGLASLGWVADSFLPFLQEIALWSAARWRGQPFETHFGENAAKLVLPLLWFGGLCLFLYWRRRKSLQPRDYQSVVPQPQRGLIVMLSKYGRFKDSTAPVNASGISQAIKDKKLDLAQVMSGCNWGQLAFVVRYHAPVLQKCWVIVTNHSPKQQNGSEKKDGSIDEFPDAERLINYLARDFRPVACECVVINDANDIGQAAQAVSGIYRSLGQTDARLKPSQVMADFTGGTAAMSGGMILATLDEGREVEYLTRRATLTPDFTVRDIQEQQLIVSPRISLGLARTLTGSR